MSVRRLRRGEKIVVASHNAGKVREIVELLAPFGVEAVSAGALDLPEPEETGVTFEANARLKAEAAAQASGLPSLADDSGFCVAALGGDPGIYSARWAGPGKDFAVAMQAVREKMGDARDMSAWFVCVLAIAWPDGEVTDFRGEVRGEVAWPPLGENGFGYDPMFRPTGHGETFGEMEPAAKHAMSHRADAFRLFVDACLRD